MWFIIVVVDSDTSHITMANGASLTRKVESYTCISTWLYDGSLA